MIMLMAMTIIINNIIITITRKIYVTYAAEALTVKECLLAFSKLRRKRKVVPCRNTGIFSRRLPARFLAQASNAFCL